MASKKKLWYIEEAGVRVRLYRYQRRWWYALRLPDGGYERRSLKTEDRAEAEERARALAKAIARRSLLGVKPDAVTLDQLFDAYNRYKLPLLRDSRERPIRVMQRMFTHAWGGDLVIRTLSQSHIERYAAERRSGRLSPFKQETVEVGKRKRRVVTKGRKPAGVREGTIANDLRWLSSVFNFAVDHEHDGAPLLGKNPLRKLKLPKEKNPRRPVASQARFLRTLDHVDGIDPQGRLRCALSLVRYTGRRIDAVCKLWVSDVLLTPDRVRDALASTGRDERLADHMPHGAIRWRPENDKQGFDELTALSEPARTALDLYLRTRAAIGDTPLFPAPGGRRKKKKKDEKPKPIGKHLMRQWLLRAEAAANLPKLDQGVWHPYRRLWAVERKDLPDVDVAAAGGWRDTRALKLSYQQADPATMLRVVQHGT